MHETLHSPCICRLTLACILRETSTKRHQKCWHLLSLVKRPLCGSSGLSIGFSNFCWLCHSLNSQLKADCSPLPSDVDCLSASPFANSPLASLGPGFPPLLPVLPEISSSSPLFWFRTKKDKENVCLAHHPHSVTLRKLAVTQSPVKDHQR